MGDIEMENAEEVSRCKFSRKTARTKANVANNLDKSFQGKVVGFVGDLNIHDVLSSLVVQNGLYLGLRKFKFVLV